MADPTTDFARTCEGCGHEARLHYALGHVGCHDLRCDCTWLAPQTEIVRRLEDWLIDNRWSDAYDLAHALAPEVERIVAERLAQAWDEGRVAITGRAHWPPSNPYRATTPALTEEANHG